MSKLAEDNLKTGCDHWRQCSGTVDITKHGTSFIVDLESSIRQAWRQDLASGPLQAMLISLCLDFAPYVRRHDSFGALLGEIPQFAVAFSQRALGSIVSSLRLPKPSQTMDSGPIHDMMLFPLGKHRSVMDPTADEERKGLGRTSTSKLARRGATRPPK